MGKVKTLWISRTKLKGVRITCGGRFRDTSYKIFVPVKAQIAKDHHRQAFSWTEADLNTRHSEGRPPK